MSVQKHIETANVPANVALAGDGSVNEQTQRLVKTLLTDKRLGR